MTYHGIGLYFRQIKIYQQQNNIHWPNKTTIVASDKYYWFAVVRFRQFQWFSQPIWIRWRNDSNVNHILKKDLFSMVVDAIYGCEWTLRASAEWFVVRGMDCPSKGFCKWTVWACAGWLALARQMDICISNSLICTFVPCHLWFTEFISAQNYTFFLVGVLSGNQSIIFVVVRAASWNVLNTIAALTVQDPETKPHFRVQSGTVWYSVSEVIS